MKRVLKQLISIVLVLSLFVPGAMAADHSPMVSETLPSWTIDVISHDGILYVLTGDGLYQKVEEGWMLLDSTVMYALDMDADDETVYLIEEAYDEEDSGYRILRMAFQDQGMLAQPTESCSIHWDIDSDAWVNISGFAVQGGDAYLLIENVMFGGGDCILYRVSLSDGKGEKVLAGPFTELIGYKDGLLLARQYNESEALQPDGTYLPPEVVTIDPENGTTTLIGVMDNHNDGALAYDAETDNIYFSNSSGVFRVTDSAPEQVGRLFPSFGMREYSHAAIYQGRYYIDDELDGVISSSVDPALMATHVLRIEPSDGIEPQLRDFAKQHPEIAIEYVLDVPREADKFLDSMKTAQVDVYSCWLESDFIHLRDKKYVADLASSDVLTNTVQAMIPNLTRELLVEGHLYALPVGIGGSMPGYYPAAFEEAGISLEEIPKSYEELLDFIVTWYEEYLPYYDNIAFWRYAYDLFADLLERIIDTQILTCIAEGVPVTFDTPAMHSLLNRLVDLKSVIYEVAPPSEEWNDKEFALFMDSCRVRPERYLSREAALRLSLDDQTPPVVQVYLDVMYINPYSENVDMAMELLEYLAQNLDICTATALMVDQNEPIETMGHADNLAYAQERVALAELALAEAAEADRADFEEALRMAQDFLSMVESERFAMTSEEIAEYRQEIAAYYTCMTDNFATVNNSEQISNLRQRLIDGQIGADEFIRQMESIVRMMQLER